MARTLFRPAAYSTFKKWHDNDFSGCIHDIGTTFMIPEKKKQSPSGRIRKVSEKITQFS